MSRSVFPHKAIQPCLPKPAKEPPAGPDWLHEIKHDGFRILARRDGNSVRLYTRDGYNFADRFPRIVKAIKSLPVQSCFIDGEAIVVDTNGLATFDLLRSWRHNHAAVLCAFDLIELDGKNLRRAPIEQRKRALANLLSREHEGIAFNRHYDGEGAVIYKHACALGCEGIVSKRLGSTYRSGRVNDWLKIKNPAAPAVRREAEEDWNGRWVEKIAGSRRRKVRTVLFLCTGNYYRSRFAEELFNHHAERAGLDWTAQSRGLALERGAHNVGPISPVALHGLKELAIPARGADRFPQQCTASDLASADFVVAVKEAEHRPLMREQFAEWEHVPDYWNVHDVEDAAPAEALNLLAQEVQTLLQRFRRAYALALVNDWSDKETDNRPARFLQGREVVKGRAGHRADAVGQRD